MGRPITRTGPVAEAERAHKRALYAADPEPYRARVKAYREADPELFRSRDRERNKDPRRKASMAERARRDHARYSESMAQLKAQPCVDCGIQYPVPAMEWDHVRGVKRFNVTASSMARRDFAAELAKCELRCANCHRVRHAAERESEN